MQERRRTIRPPFASVAVLLFVAAAAPAQESASPRPVDRATFEGWVEELSNWGRWGEDDQRGTLNLITDGKRREAAALVRKGVSVSLSHPLITREAADAGNPFGHTMLMTGAGDGDWAVDRFSVVYHGYAHSHMDALCHRFHEGRIYNGFPRAGVDDEGCESGAITTAKDGVFTRGVLIDLPRLRGEEWLAPGTAIYAEDLEAWEERAGVTVAEGDVLLIRTGRWVHRAEQGPSNPDAGAAGLHASAATWLRERGVAALGSEAASDVLPSGVEGYSHPVHVLALVAMGMPILDNLDLDALGEEAERQGRWEFLLTFAPLVVENGTGSPVNPIATF